MSNTRTASRSQVPEPLAPGGHEALAQRRLVVGGERSDTRRRPARAPRASSSPTRSRRNFSCTSVRLSTLLVRGLRQRPCRPARSAAATSGPRSGWPSTNRANADRVEHGAVAQDQRDHHLVAGLLVGHAVDRGHHHVGMTGDGRLDRPGGEVLAVDADPLGGASREVEVAVARRGSRGRRSSTSRCACVRALASSLL